MRGKSRKTLLVLQIDLPNIGLRNSRLFAKKEAQSPRLVN